MIEYEMPENVVPDEIRKYDIKDDVNFVIVWKSGDEMWSDTFQISDNKLLAYDDEIEFYDTFPMYTDCWGNNEIVAIFTGEGKIEKQMSV